MPVTCQQCGVGVPDTEALLVHELDTHLRTRQQVEEQRADEIMAAAVDRQQDAVGRREQAGQPGGGRAASGERRAASADRRRDRMNPSQPDEDVGQQTQQQQRQVE